MNDFFKFYSGSLSGTIIVIIIFLFIRFLLRKQSNYIKNNVVGDTFDTFIVSGIYIYGIWHFVFGNIC